MQLFHKIGTKLSFLIGLTVILIFGLHGYITVVQHKDSIIKEVERHANQLSETVKMSLHDDMLANRRDHLQNMILKIGSEASIANIRILNKEGDIIYSVDSAEVGNRLDKKAESCFVCHQENQPLRSLPIKNRTRIYRIPGSPDRLMGIINPISNETSCYNSDCHVHTKDQTVLGVLDIAVNLKSVDEQVNSNTIETVIFTLFGILAISVILSFFIRRWVSKPVSELVNATNQIAVGKLNYTVSELSRDELGVLGKSFNNMTKKLSEMRIQLFQSDKMASLGRLAAGIAHEINNPLTGVLTYSSFLLKRTKDNPEFQEDLNVIVRETKRSREIVKGLLDFSRQSAPKKLFADINEVIERAEKVIVNQLKINHINLELNIDPKTPKVSMDANQIQQVFLNLFVNAIDAIGPKGGSIKVDVSEIELQPYGTVQIKKAVCPKNHSLMDESHKIDGMPSIKLKIKTSKSDGFIHLDPIYGRNNHHYGISIEKGEITKIYCPECGTSLVDENEKHDDCGAPIYKITIPGKGIVTGCVKYGCKIQKWDYIESKGDKSFVQIIVEDSGCGIPEENLSNIFEPFFSSKGQKGTGLGLSVIWGIIDIHNGTITVDSEVGKGTKFKIRLPLNDE